MTLAYLLISFFIFTIPSTFLQLQPVRNQINFTFSPVAANPTNLIDIKNLTLSDFESVVSEEYGVFLIRDNSQKQVYFNDKQLQDFVLSPSKQRVIFSYDLDEPDKESLSITQLSLDNYEIREIFTTEHPSWDITSNMHWLGNSYVVFFRHCGSSCQGLTLLNVDTSEVKNATLSYMSFSDQTAFTHFLDWFGNKHNVPNFIGGVNTELVDGKAYLIFSIVDEEGVPKGDERFLFIDGLLQKVS